MKKINIRIKVFVCCISISSLVSCTSAIDQDSLLSNELIQDFGLFYETSDSIFLYDVLNKIEQRGMKCASDSSQFLFDKIRAYICLKKYDTVVNLCEECLRSDNPNIRYWGSFGPMMYLYKAQILKNNESQNYTERELYIDSLIDYMDACIALQVNYSVYDSLYRTTTRNVYNVNPNDYGVLWDYYHVKLLRTKRAKIIEDLQNREITIDSEGCSIKNQMIEYFETVDSCKFYSHPADL